MSAMETVLLIIGAVIFIGSFLIPATKSREEKNEELSEEMIREMVGKEVASAKTQISDIVDETISYAMEKTERSMDRLTNEKMMAVNEYSDTVLTEIDKNHKEVVFLYDMLNDKHENIKSTVSLVEKKAKEVSQTVRDAEITADEVKQSVESAEASAREVKESLKESRLNDIIYEETVPEKPTESANQTPNFRAFVPERIERTTEDSVPVLETIDMDDSGNNIIGDPNMPGENATISVAEWEVIADLAKENIAAEQIEINANEAKSAVELEGADEAVLEETIVNAEKDAIANEVIDREIAKPVESTKKEKKTSSGISVKSRPTTSDGPDLALEMSHAGKAGGRNNNDMILEMHKAGKSNMAIAKKLGLGLGEVKLVIDLFEGQ